MKFSAWNERRNDFITKRASHDEIMNQFFRFVVQHLQPCFLTLGKLTTTPSFF